MELLNVSEDLPPRLMPGRCRKCFESTNDGGNSSLTTGRREKWEKNPEPKDEGGKRVKREGKRKTVS